MHGWRQEAGRADNAPAMDWSSSDTLSPMSRTLHRRGGPFSHGGQNMKRLNEAHLKMMIRTIKAGKRTLGSKAVTKPTTQCLREANIFFKALRRRGPASWKSS